MNRSEKNKLTYKAIVDSAINIFSQNSYETASIADITKQANISKGIVYHYFDSKDELYLTCLEKYISDLVEFSSSYHFENVSTDTFSKLRNDFFDLNPNYRKISHYVTLEQPSHLKEKISLLKEPLRILNASICKKLFENMAFGKGISIELAIKYFNAIQYAIPMIFEVDGNTEEEVERFIKIFFNGLTVDLDERNKLI